MANNSLYNSSIANLYRSIGQQRGVSPAFVNASIAQGIAESSLNPGARGDGGQASGLHQWHPDRYQQLLALSQKMNLPPTDPRVQINHWYNENQKNLTIGDPRAANDAAIGSERPAGWKPGDPTGVPSYNKRLGDTYALMRMAAGQPNPQDPNSFVATASDATPQVGGDVTPQAQSISLGDQENTQPLNNIGSTLANMGASIAALDRHGTGIASLNASRVASNLAAQEQARETQGGWKYAGQTQNGQGLMFQNSRGEIRVEPLAPGFSGNKESSTTQFLKEIQANPGLADTYKSIHGGDEVTLSPEAVANAAARIKAGEKGVLNRFSKNNAALVAEKVAKDTGDDPTQILENQIAATGKSAEARTIGTGVGKSALSAGTFASGVTNALDASKLVGRGQFVPFNQIEQLVKKNASDPNVLDFKAAHQTLIREYAKAINPNGNPTVSDMNHARELLDTATDEPAYERVVQRLQSEVAQKQANLEKLNGGRKSTIRDTEGSQPKRLKYNPTTGELE